MRDCISVILTVGRLQTAVYAHSKTLVLFLYYRTSVASLKMMVNSTRFVPLPIEQLGSDVVFREHKSPPQCVDI